MKLSNRIDGSICGAILSSRPVPSWSGPPSTAISRPASRCRSQKPFPTWPPQDLSCRIPRLKTQTRCCPATGRPTPCLWDISLRLTTSSCPRSGPLPARRRYQTSAVPKANDELWRQHQPVADRKELLSYVDQPKDEDTVDDHLEFLRDPYLRRYAPAHGPELTVSDRREDVEHPSRQDVKEYEQSGIARDLRKAILLRLRNPQKHRAEDIYNLYRQLPEPRMAHLSAKLRHWLFKSLGTLGKRDSKSMLRYFSLVADVKNSGLSLISAEWNTAISFASRYVGQSTHTEAEAAITLWREMEQEAGVKANEVTFNILFDVASKAGNFTLAEMIYKEMETRGFAFNRYHHVSLIHFFGLKMDADGVRAAYREMVEAGEMVDVVTLNCVIAGLLRCGEEDAANRVYERMKASNSRAALMPQRSYISQKAVSQVLMMFAKLGQKHPAMRAGFQAAAPITPDISTYRILIHHHAVKLGDIAAVAKYLDEMKYFRVQLHGSIFLALFKAFTAHGGFPGSNWSEQRLNSVWQAMLHALDGDAAGLYINSWLAMWALRAFDKCSSPEMVFKTYNALSVRWDLDEANSDFMIGFLHSLLKHKPGHIRMLQSLAKGSHEFTLG